ncbi:hypothetical protein BDV98DRAFT_593370 [Pterulicium gracile]|uniref:Uncharacterized protein n=1 Tax=Pterulicium gracile TaxID=1884261 RepID=A0A5C3QIB0_9AGAR|nr:hypothetical protein BDV98DRAFT_593370 [Pterula gracilis]
MNFVPESQTPSDESEPINTVCINVLRNCFTKLYNNNERLRTSVHNEPVFNNFLSEWILAHNTLAKLQATKKKLFTCKCDKNDFVIADLHTSSNTPRSVEFYVYAFKEFSHQIWTLLATFPYHYLLGEKFKGKDEGYLELMRVVLGEQVDMYRTYFLWWEDVMDTAPVTFAPAALQYPDSSASLKEAIVDFPQLPPLLVQVLRYNVDQYLNTQSPIMYEVVIKNHQGFVFLTTTHTLPLAMLRMQSRFILLTNMPTRRLVPPHKASSSNLKTAPRHHIRLAHGRQRDSGMD